MLFQSDVDRVVVCFGRSVFLVYAYRHCIILKICMNYEMTRMTLPIEIPDIQNTSRWRQN